jgi:Flp pilus assembly protein TadD
MDYQVVFAAGIIAFGLGVGMFMRIKPTRTTDSDEVPLAPAKPSGPPPDIAALLREADGLIGEGDTDRASVLLAQAASIDSERPGLAYVRSRLLHAQGDTQQAVKMLEKACKGQPDVAAWHGVRGSLLLELERPDLAYLAFQQVLELEPDNEDAQQGVKVSLDAQG